MSRKSKIRLLIGDVVGMVACFALFVVPFIFMLVNALKDRTAANRLSLAWPEQFCGGAGGWKLPDSYSF